MDHSPVTETIRRFTYRELRDEVALCGGGAPQPRCLEGRSRTGLHAQHTGSGDDDAASARLGAVHSVVFGGFASNELAVRIDDARPKVIVWASCGIEPGRVIAYKPLLDGALGQAVHRPAACLLLQRPIQEAALEPGRCRVDIRDA